MRRARGTTGTILLCLLCGAAPARPQAAVRHKTFRDFQNGRAENVAILGSGALELGPHFAPLEAMKPEAFVWALAADSRGRVYAATGNRGLVYRVEGGKANVALRTGDLAVLSLCVGADDTVYAGCAPSGRIWRIPSRGEPEVLCETGQTYVWALARDKTGTLYAGTGPAGKVLKITPDGRKVATLCDSRDKHILSLVLSRGAVFAGTDVNGLVYRITPAGKASIAFDAPNKELRCMAADHQGNVYVGSADGIRPAPTTVPRRTTRTTTTAPAPRGMAEGTTKKKSSRTAKGPPAYAPPKRPGPPGVSGANRIYHLHPDGKVTTLLRMNGIAFLSMRWHDGALYVGTAGEGKVLRVVSEREMAVLAAKDQPQVLALCVTPAGALLFGTGNDGRLYVAKTRRENSGTYTSDVIDARVRSAWGAVQILGDVPQGTRVQLRTRSGNAGKPDNTWSQWAATTSPPARYLQYQLTLSARDVQLTPRVTQVAFPYLSDNYPPSIESIEVSTEVPARPPPKKPPPKGAPPPRDDEDGCVAGTAVVSWRAADPNDDELEYALYFRGRGEKDWKLLGEHLDKTSHKWDTEAVPDGVYRLKLVASDGPSNPPPRALADELVSEPVTVDNSPPAVKITASQCKAGRCSVACTVTDAGSNLVRARYSVDAGRWNPLLPTDHIYDARTERLSLTTDELTPGEHTLVIQAEDASGNVGAAKTVINIPND